MDINNNKYIFEEENFNNKYYSNENYYDGLDKKDYIKLNNWYKLIEKIQNYPEKETLMYSKYGVSTKLQKIKFELKRIYKFASSKYLSKEEINSIKYLLKYYEFILDNSSFQTEKSEEYYDEIFSLIIKLEVSLDMQIGLYEELINYYESNFKVINKEKYKLLDIQNQE